MGDNGIQQHKGFTIGLGDHSHDSLSRGSEKR